MQAIRCPSQTDFARWQDGFVLFKEDMAYPEKLRPFDANATESDSEHDEHVFAIGQHLRTLRPVDRYRQGSYSTKVHNV
jgi:hypothetical protein